MDDSTARAVTVVRQPDGSTERLGPMCKDHDDECPDVRDKLACWLHAPECGWCPYLQRETP